MSLNITQTASERANVQANANSYFNGSQEFLDDQAAQVNALIALDCEHKANLISQWCSCNDFKDMNNTSTFSINVGLIDGNTLNAWESDLTSQGFIVTFNGSGSLPPDCINSAGYRYAVDRTLTISL